MQINDNVYKNLNKFSIKSFDTSDRLHKQEFTDEEMNLIVQELAADKGKCQH